MNDYQDKEIKCAEGGNHVFTWTAKDQEFYAEKGFSQPKRCRQHAQERRAYFDSHPEKAQVISKKHQRHEDYE